MRDCTPFTRDKTEFGKSEKLPTTYKLSLSHLRELVRDEVEALARLGRDGREADGVLLQTDQLPQHARVVGPELGRCEDLQVGIYVKGGL